MAMEQQRRDEAGGDGGEDKEVVYKTKTVEFLGRSTPIILQNDNGPCPLLAICNVLLLRNIINLGPDASEVSLQKLLHLVAERLIDSNSNIEDKDELYVSNQQQNIGDAIDLLPRLSTGIDVNLQFRKINDFEFTRECAIFDLLDIGLYHGWIVDPQDNDTAAAIGSKSYNTLVGELVAFETRKSEVENKSTLEEDCVDFAAATTATLGVPSPILSRGKSFDDCPVSVPVEQLRGKGDIEEALELIRVLNLSKDESSCTPNASVSSDSDCTNSSLTPDAITNTESSGLRLHGVSVVERVVDQFETSHQSVTLELQEHNPSSDGKADDLYSKASLIGDETVFPSIITEDNTSQSVSEGSCDFLIPNNSIQNARADLLIRNEATPFKSEGDGSDGCNSYKDPMTAAEQNQSVTQPCTESVSDHEIHHKPADSLVKCDSAVVSVPAAPCTDSHLSNGRDVGISEVFLPSLEGSEPIYEGEEHILDSGLPVYGDREPVYEGEMVLADQADKLEEDTCSVYFKHGDQQQWQLIKNFLENSASQLTIYGLFCLQEGLKERELGVFFRNNHFNTMFKYNGELYLLATDQGYINQLELVWEKLNEVNGDTIFMTGNFMEFKAENQANGLWSEQNAMTSTADYLASLDEAPSRSNLSSDLELAIALQQQEFEQQPQRHPQQSQQQPSGSGRSRLVTGPHPPRNSNPSPITKKNESKSKDRCVVM